MSVDEVKNVQVMEDVEMIMENCPITILKVHTYKAIMV